MAVCKCTLLAKCQIRIDDIFNLLTVKFLKLTTYTSEISEMVKSLQNKNT